MVALTVLATSVWLLNSTTYEKSECLSMKATREFALPSEMTRVSHTPLCAQAPAVFCLSVRVNDRSAVTCT